MAQSGETQPAKVDCGLDQMIVCCRAFVTLVAECPRKFLQTLRLPESGSADLGLYLVAASLAAALRKGQLGNFPQRESRETAAGDVAANVISK